MLPAPPGAAPRSRRASTRGPGDGGAGKSRGPALPWPRIAGFRTETPPPAAAVLAAAGRAPPPRGRAGERVPAAAGSGRHAGAGPGAKLRAGGRARETLGGGARNQALNGTGAGQKKLRDWQELGEDPGRGLCEVCGRGAGGQSLRLVACDVASHPPDTPLIFPLDTGKASKVITLSSMPSFSVARLLAYHLRGYVI